MNPLVSICLATYNGEKYLKEQLDSIVAQTYTNIELIVQDDYSTDTTLEILQAYKEKLNITIYSNKKNLGYLKNFESLLHKTNGDYIALCDQDDIWEHDKIKLLVEHIADATLIYSNSLLIDAEGNSLNKTLSTKLKNNFISSTNPLDFLYDNCVSAHAMLFKKELLQTLFPFPQHIYFDAWIAINAANTNSIIYFDKELVFYRQHDTNTLGNVNKSKTSNLSKIAKKVQKKEDGINYILQKIQDLQKLQNISQKDLLILGKLQTLYERFYSSYFNKELFRFLLQHKTLFFNITKKDPFKIALKHAIGKKLYKVAPFL
jgi:glycosyltransferase involved in cell wall biosynthesis